MDHYTGVTASYSYPSMGTSVTHVVGARPNFPKATPVVTALSELGVRQRVVHTGQHHDASLTTGVMDDVGLKDVDVDLSLGSGDAADRLPELVAGVTRELTTSPPALVVVYGDVDSTVAGAAAAASQGVPVAHVEAGLRSGDVTMPEEVNRIVVDRLSALLFATADGAVANLVSEGIPADRCHMVGNPMADSLLANRHRLEPQALARRMGLASPYAMVTLHRPGNVDVKADRIASATALLALADHLDVVFAAHPRSAELAAMVAGHPRVHVTEPMGYIEFLSAVAGAGVVVTDSGGVQEETTLLGVPCLTMRPNTERPVTIDVGTNKLVAPADVVDEAIGIVDGIGQAHAAVNPPLWDGRAGERIAGIIAQWLGGGAVLRFDGADDLASSGTPGGGP